MACQPYKYSWYWCSHTSLDQYSHTRVSFFVCEALHNLVLQGAVSHGSRFIVREALHVVQEGEAVYRGWQTGVIVVQVFFHIFCDSIQYSMRGQLCELGDGIPKHYEPEVRVMCCSQTMSNHAWVPRGSSFHPRLNVRTQTSIVDVLKVLKSLNTSAMILLVHAAHKGPLWIAL